MWPLDRTSDDRDSPQGVDDHLTVSGEPEGEASGPEDPVREAPVAVDPRAERDRWIEQIRAVGGRSPLLHFPDEPRTRIELSSTHPGGLPQFITGHSTLLSNLIRDELALRRAKSAADVITTKGVELRTVRGIESIHLAIGLAQWRHEGEDFCAPVLLRPVAIRRYGKDFELKLKGRSVMNPELVRAMRDHFGIALNAERFEALSVTNGVFQPQPVIDELRGITRQLDWFSVQPRLLVSSFADVGAALARDVAAREHPILEALTGDAGARKIVESLFLPVDAVRQDERPPTTDTLLLDADAEQENVIAQITAGNSLVVTTLPGTGGTQTVVNALGALVGQHRRVLVVGARRSGLDSIRHRLSKVGLPGLSVGPTTVRRDLIEAISRNEKAVAPKIADVDDALVRLRRVLLDYRGSLGRVDPELKVSVLDALGSLTRLGNLPVPPSTAARLDTASMAGLAGNRRPVAHKLATAAALGEFQYGPDDSPWYGARFATTVEAKATHALAKKLNRTELPRLLERGYDLIGQTRMRPFESVEELGIYLRLLLDIRDTLDRFSPAVFDRSLDELIIASSSRRDSPEMSAANRRRLKKLAREYVRPGVHIADMYESLRKIQGQRVLWQRYVSTGAVPEVPLGIADVQVSYQRVVDDLGRLDGPLGRVTKDERLVALPVKELVRLMAGLAADSEVMENLQERTTLIAELKGMGLAPLITDMSVRHVPEERVADELELAWWQSVLEHLLATDKALLGANTSVIDRLEADFRLVDEAHASASGAQLATLLADTWKIGLVDHAEEAAALRTLLRAAAVDPADLEGAAPHLSRILSPVWIASPYEVHLIPESLRFDAVFLVDAGATTLAENAAAIGRAKQVVAFGDPVTQSPIPFNIAAADPSRVQTPAYDVEAMHRDSALARLGDLLPTLTLTRSYRAGGEDLSQLVNQRFYDGEIESLPWAGSFLGHGSLTVDYVSGGRGMPDADTGGVESVDAEVSRVVNLVLEHAASRPRESLMVVTASVKHATRVHQAVLSAFSQRSDLAEFILKDRAEPFAVFTLDQSVAESRDRVIFSLGYGLTPHGRVLSHFGSLGEPGGDRLLAVGMTRARRSMVIVSCIRPEDIDPARTHHGIAALAEILRQPVQHVPAPPNTEGAEPMMVDLAERLYRRGLDVEVGYRGSIALVASYGGKAIAVESDPEVTSESLRESLRLRPDVLRRLGWHYLRVHSFDLFADPEGVASKVTALLGVPEEIPAAHTDPGRHGS
ncbi:AAA family ATPase [Mycetocola spongiae]|uniref:AAA family ATPase n=1 Tax=Mycetocola spongiae TaxID=2859226 RepID=UPI001CF0DE52|nr:AAA family ATPase [Mycetocola spongiae]UCR88851.1 AAA family ATPase [Mycetocola spongiae]